ncbi:MAG: hypothetical protein WAW06_12865 [bacterium]
MRRKSIYLSPAGSALVVVSFFLPWARISCGPVVDRTVTGASLGGPFWVAFGLAATALAGFVGLRLGWRGRPDRWAPERWAPAFALVSVAALAVVLMQSLRLAGEARGKMVPLADHAVGFALKFGAVATVAGLVVSILGAVVAARSAPGGRDGGRSR